MLYKELKTRAISNISTINTYKQQLVNVNNDIADLNKSNEDIKNKLHLLSKSLEVMKVCITKLSEGHIHHLNTIVNSMLKQVFDDKNYEIEFQLNDNKNGKILNIILKDIISPDEVVVTDIHDNGGGLQTIVGFILQIYFIIYFKQEHIIFLDEQLSALSSEYIPNLISFMGTLVKEYNFTFVSVIHDKRFIDNILDQSSLYIRLYNIEDGRVTYTKEYNKEIISEATSN